MRGAFGRLLAVAAIATAVVAVTPHHGVATTARTGWHVANYRETGFYRLPSGRTYYLRHTRWGAPQPLVIALHGAYLTAGHLQTSSGLTPYSDTHGFAVAYGNSVGGVWNAGSCCGTADDVQYVADVIADAEKQTRIDPTRVYVVGFSNGGMMAWRAACELPQVAAGLSMAGVLVAPCPHVVRMLQITGLNDGTVPFYGGQGWQHRVFPPVWDTPMMVPEGSTVMVLPVVGLGHSWWSQATWRGYRFLSNFHE